MKSALKSAFKSSLNVPSSEIPKEAYQPHVDYAITINPPEMDETIDRWDFAGIHEENIKAINEMRRMIVRFSDIATFILYVEFSKMGRLHYHGTFNLHGLKETIDFKVFVIPILKKYQICIRPIQDFKEMDNKTKVLQYDTWFEYCTKETKATAAAGYPEFIRNNLLRVEEPQQPQIIEKKKRTPKKEIISN